MKMFRDDVRWLRAAYWIGALVDVFFGIAMLHPPLLRLALQAPDLIVTVETRVALGMGAPLMFAWATLLFWADRAPLARKDVLVITCVPNVAGLMVTSIFALSADVLAWPGAISSWLLGGALVSIFLIGYGTARRAEAAAAHPAEVDA